MSQTDEDNRARLHLLSTALDLAEHRLISRDCQNALHGRCEGHAQAGRLHPMLQHQTKGPVQYDQPLPCFCGCHELFKPR